MKEDLLSIIKHYGVLPQLKYFQSEVFELNQAIIEREIHWSDDTSVQDIRPLNIHIAEEIADCCVMLGQFKNHYGITDEELEKICLFKIKRQLERIEKEHE